MINPPKKQKIHSDAISFHAMSQKFPAYPHNNGQIDITKHPQKCSTHPNAKSEKEANEQRRSLDPHAEKPNLFTFPHKLLTESSARNHKTGKRITNNCNCFTKPVKQWQKYFCFWRFQPLIVCSNISFGYGFYDNFYL